MKVLQIINGAFVKIEMTYEEVCRRLGGYSPEVGFIKVLPSGKISFTLGKPDEIRELRANCYRHGFFYTARKK